jgi:hypothetical protein
MYTLRFLLRIAAMLFFAVALCSATQAAVARTFVSVTGSDANPCTFTSPCRLFQHAHDIVADGGEVIALTSGAYGTLTITKNVTISGVGVSAVASPFSTEDVITIATPGITVVLRSISIRAFGAGTGGHGINVTAVGNLHVEDCVISGFAVNGINVNLTADGSYIFIKDTISRNNYNGISIQTSTGIVRASIDNCRAERNTNVGFRASDNSRVTINRSVASGNGATGFYTNSFGGSAELSCEECVSSNNSTYGFGVNAFFGGTATIRVSHSTATNNGSFGFYQFNPGVFESLGNNLVRGNTGGDTTGTITTITAL